MHKEVDVLANHGFNVQRTRRYVWPDNGVDSSLLVSTSERAVDGLESWSYAFGLTNRSTRSITVGTATVWSTNTAPDGSYTVSQVATNRLLSTTRYDANDNQLTSTSLGYDEFNRRETSTDARNGTTTFALNNAGQATSITSPPPTGGGSSLVTSNLFDSVGRIWKTVEPDGASVTNVYYSTGLLKRKSGARNYPVEYTYDYAGRMKTLKTWQNFASDAGAAVTTWNYDSERGWLDNKQYADGQGPAYDYTDAGRLETRTWARTVGGQPLTTTYGYDNAGQQTSIDYSDSTPDITHTYNRRGQKATVSQSDGTTQDAITFTYNDAGQLLSEAHTAGLLSGFTVTNAFDSLYRRSNLGVLDNGNSVYSTDYGYDDASRLLSVGDGTNTATYSYLADSPLVNQITFTNSGQLRMVTTKAYDKLNSLTQIASTNSSETISSFDYIYNSASQRTKATREDGSYWVYEYDSLGQVTSGKKYFADDTPIPGMQFEYGFDDIGNRKKAASGGDENGANLREEHYSANLLNQYTGRSNPGFVDVLGSAKTNSTVTVNNKRAYRKAAFYRAELGVDNSAGPAFLSLTNLAVLNDSPNEDIVTNEVGNAFIPPRQEVITYDDDGNTLSDGRWKYTWNGENRLIELETTDAAVVAGAPQQKLEFAYDHQGRRIEKIVSEWNGSSWDGQVTNRFTYDRWNLIAEVNDAGTLIRSYSWGLDLSGAEQGAGGVGGLLFQNHGEDGVHFAAYDGNGNVVALAAATDGTESASYEYGPFGALITETGAQVPQSGTNPFRFSTKYQDDETGMQYYGYRYLKDGRWINRDPIGERGGVNLFLVNYNDPVNRIDPDGKVSWPVVIVVGAGLFVCGQQAACAKHVSDLAWDAYDEVKAKYKKDPAAPGTKADALKHCVAACNIAKDDGPCWTRKGALAMFNSHENGKDPASKMDLENNRVGAIVGSTNPPPKSCYNSCLKMLLTGNLFGVPTGGKWPIKNGFAPPPPQTKGI